MGIFDRLFGTQPGDDDYSDHSMPWDNGPSIYEHVKSHVDPDVSGLSEAGQTLPDEDRINEDGQIRFAAGAMDGIATHHMGSGGQDEQVRNTVRLLLAFCEQPTAVNKAEVYRNVINENTVSIIDSALEALANEQRINHQRLYELAYSFVTEATDREPVKFGIAILGLYDQTENEELFQTLGRHDEFTLYCAVALANTADDPDDSLWQLARNVDGWGRIHVVERLSQTEDAAIKEWLLREGYRNSVMYEYLAFTCATAGGLLAAVSRDEVDRDLLTSAGELIQALIIGGPAEDIDEYDDAALVVEMFLRHIDDRAETILDFLHINIIKRYLTDAGADWDERSQRGWTESRRAELLEICNAVLQRPEWTEQVNEALNSDDDLQFYNASQAAETLGIDTWEHRWRRWEQDSTDPYRWFDVVSEVDEQRLSRVLKAAAESIDLDAVATGPSDELGLGPGYEHHSCLDYLLQELQRFPGEGARYIEAGLQSPVVRNRAMAVEALAEWQPDQRTKSLLSALRSAIRNEPDEDVRDRMKDVLEDR